MYFLAVGKTYSSITEDEQHFYMVLRNRPDPECVAFAGQDQTMLHGLGQSIYNTLAAVNCPQQRMALPDNMGQVYSVFLPSIAVRENFGSTEEIQAPGKRSPWEETWIVVGINGYVIVDSLEQMIPYMSVQSPLIYAMAVWGGNHINPAWKAREIYSWRFQKRYDARREMLVIPTNQDRFFDKSFEAREKRLNENVYDTKAFKTWCDEHSWLM